MAAMQEEAMAAARAARVAHAEPKDEVSPSLPTPPTLKLIAHTRMEKPDLRCGVPLSLLQGARSLTGLH